MKHGFFDRLRSFLLHIKAVVAPHLPPPVQSRASALPALRSGTTCRDGSGSPCIDRSLVRLRLLALLIGRTIQLELLPRHYAGWVGPLDDWLLVVVVHQPNDTAHSVELKLMIQTLVARPLTEQTLVGPPRLYLDGVF